jgi:hypothetical protein
VHLAMVWEETAREGATDTSSGSNV